MSSTRGACGSREPVPRATFAGPGQARPWCVQPGRTAAEARPAQRRARLARTICTHSRRRALCARLDTSAVQLVLVTMLMDIHAQSDIFVQRG